MRREPIHHVGRSVCSSTPGRLFQVGGAVCARRTFGLSCWRQLWRGRIRHEFLANSYRLRRSASTALADSSANRPSSKAPRFHGTFQRRPRQESHACSRAPLPPQRSQNRRTPARHRARLPNANNHGGLIQCARRGPRDAYASSSCERPVSPIRLVRATRTCWQLSQGYSCSCPRTIHSCDSKPSMNG